jgi:DNA-binding NarL/FixJ family response regulator
MSKTSVAIVEDDPGLLEALRRVIVASEAFTLAWTADSLEAARRQLTCGCALLILDLSLPDGGGLGLLPALRRCQPRTRVIAYTVFDDEAHVVAAVEAGIDAYLLKESSAEDLLDALAQTRDGASPISPSVARYLLRRLRRVEETAGERPVSLTPREREVLERLARGYSYREVGSHLGMTPHTVAHHVKNIYPKLAVASRAQAVYRALQDGLISLDP